MLHTKEDTAKVNLLNSIAYNLYTIDIEKTFFYAKESFELADKLNFLKGKAESLRLIGIYYTITANYPMALENLQMSLKINEEISFKKGIADCMNSIGIVYNRQGNSETALGYYHKAMKLFEELGNQNSVSYCLNNIGVIHYETGNYTKALDYYLKSLEVNELLGNNDEAAIGLNNIGEVFMKLKEYDKAIDYFQQSLKFSEEIGDSYGISYLYKDFGTVYLETNDYSKALNYSLRSLELAEEIDYFDIQKDIHLQLSEIYKNIRNYKEAYTHYLVYKKFSDSIFNKENVKKITGLEYQYKYEKEKQAIKAEQEKKEIILKEEAKYQRNLRNLFIWAFIIVLLLVFVVLRLFLLKKKTNEVLLNQKQEIEANNIQLNEQNEEIQQLNEELQSANEILFEQKEELKEALKDLKDTQSQLVQSERMASVGVLTAGIAHEINNPLNFIQGSKYSIEKYIKENLTLHSEQLNPYLTMLDEGIERTSEIIKSLKSFCSSNNDQKSDCDIHSVIDNCLVILRNQFKKKVQIVKKYTDAPFTIKGNEGELHHVFFNILLNALHAIKDMGLISISTKIKNDNLLITIKDNGEGISEENIHKVLLPFYTTRAPGEGTGLGMSIAYKSIKDHRGSIDYKSKKSEGTSVVVSFPIN